MFHFKRILIILHDLTMTALAVVFSILLRFEGELQESRLYSLRWGIVLFTAFAGVVYLLFGLYKAKWRFASLPDIVSIGKSVLVLSLAALIVDYVLKGADLNDGYFLGRKTIIIYAMVQIVLLVLPRMAYRYWKDRGQQLTLSQAPAAPAILVGRSYDVESALRAIQSGTLRGVHPVAILSPRRGDYGQSIRGVPVTGRPGALMDAVADLQRQNVLVRRLLVLPSAMHPEDDPDVLYHNARKLGLTLSYLRTFDDDAPVMSPIRIEELLVRPSFHTDDRRLTETFRGKCVAVTGAGGSIGSELCRKLVQFGVSRILLIENSEPALNAISELLVMDYPNVETFGHICDVRQAKRLSELFCQYRPEMVFHAAALKHVPYLEMDWEEGIRTNIFGSVNVADASVEAGVKTFVMISTDKAIEPTSMLGATKRFAENYTEALDSQKRENGEPMRLISVRFGNVLGSNGSVVPKFINQIERGGPITITHPDMIRYFMTVGEAANLVLTAARHAGLVDAPVRASTYVLKMGQPVRIVDLASRMARMSGFEPGVDIEISFTGIRPGERLHEVLFAKDEKLVELSENGIMAAQSNSPSLEKIHTYLEELQAAVDNGNRARAVAILQEAIPSYDASNAISRGPQAGGSMD